MAGPMPAPPDRAAGAAAPTVSVVVPVHDGGDAFDRCLESLARLSPRPLEVIVVEDGPAQRPRAYGDARVVRLPARRGPAAARNRGAAEARGQVFYFVDADVLLPPSAISTVAEAFSESGIEAVIGSYDRHPAATALVSQFKNLAHRFVHQQAGDHVATFWGACGAIRREAFEAIGGFDERYTSPSVEDIELGMRLARRGGRIRVRKDLEVTHLKAWTLGSLVRTDIRGRALPWSALLLAEGRLPDDLNVSVRARAAAGLAIAASTCGVASLVLPAAAPVSAAALAGLVAIDWKLWRYFASERGWWFALRAMPLQWLYYLYSAAAFAWVWATGLGGWRRARARFQEPA